MKLFSVHFSARLNSTNEITNRYIYVYVKKIRSEYMKGMYIVVSNLSDNFEPPCLIKANNYQGAVKGYLVKTLERINYSLDCLTSNETTLKN